MGAYVAMTRVKRREDLLIYRPFDLKAFQRGERPGPTLLLRHLRKEAIDWEALEQEYMPSRECTGCRALLRKPEFLISQWTRPSDRGSYCNRCLQRRKNDGTPYDCAVCGIFKPPEAFSPHMFGLPVRA